MARLTAGPARATRISWRGSLRHRLEQREAADRQERDAAGADAEAAGGERVAVFVQEHAEEEQEDEREAGGDAGERAGARSSSARPTQTSSRRKVTWT